MNQMVRYLNAVLAVCLLGWATPLGASHSLASQFEHSNFLERTYFGDPLGAYDDQEYGLIVRISVSTDHFVYA